MKRITLTCPFTGVSFEATKTADNDIIAFNPLDGSEIRMNYNGSNHQYYIRPSYWRETKTVSISEAAEMLGVTVQRVSTMIKTATLPVHVLPNGDKVILTEDIAIYNENRKCGRPRKETETC